MTLHTLTYLKDLLKTNKILCSLNFIGNRFGDEGFKLILEAIDWSDKFSELLVGNCDITEKSYEAM